jgi:outer membrane biosynthesis protein TonB
MKTFQHESGLWLLARGINPVWWEKGDVVEMKVISGPVLLYKAAMDAVSRWKYQPTYFNGEPISVEMNIFVKFQLTK